MNGREKPEVLRWALVAVAVMTSPLVGAPGRKPEKAALPAPSVVTVMTPRKRWPSPNPDASAAAFA